MSELPENGRKVSNLEDTAVMGMVGRLRSRIGEIKCEHLDVLKEIAIAQKTKAIGLEKCRKDVEKINGDREVRLAALIENSGKVVRELISYKIAGPFREPVNAVVMQLHDYHQIIEQPMDLGTIKDCIQGKGKKRYSRPQEVYDDVLLTFNNAMKYNNESHMIHVWAKKLLIKFEKKWAASIVPQIEREKVRRERETEEVRREQVAYHAEAASLRHKVEALQDDIETALSDVKEFRERVSKKIRPMTDEERGRIQKDLGMLPEKLERFFNLLLAKIPKFDVEADVIEIDLDALDDVTLWKIKRSILE